MFDPILDLRHFMGERISDAINRRGLDISKVLDDLGTSPKTPKAKGKDGELKEMNSGTFNKWTSGSNAVPTEWIPAVCDVLDCDTGYLFGEIDELRHATEEITKATGLSVDSVNVLLSKTNPYWYTLRVREKEKQGVPISEDELDGALQERRFAEDGIEDDYFQELLKAGKIQSKDEFYERFANDYALQKRLEKWDEYFVSDFSVDRHVLNAMFTSPFFRDFIKALEDCMDSDTVQDQDAMFDDEIPVGPPSKDRKILMVQWFAGLMAKHIIDGREETDNG